MSRAQLAVVTSHAIAKGGQLPKNGYPHPIRDQPREAMMLRGFRKVHIVVCLAAVLLGACERAADSDRTSDAPASAPETLTEQIRRTTAGVDGQRIQAADSEPGNWLTHGRTYSEQRFSPLAGIDDSNVGDLGLAWHYDLETHRGMEATPLVVDGVMFTTGTWSIVYAHDARTGELIWSFDPQVPREWAVHLCCDAVNRGVALWRGRVYIGTLDGRLIALDAADGSPLWSVQTTLRPYWVILPITSVRNSRTISSPTTVTCNRITRIDK